MLGRSFATGNRALRETVVAVGRVTEDQLMRRRSVAALAGMVILATGLAPARALPVCPPVATAALTISRPFVLPVKHHGHHWHWRHGREGWSGTAPPYGSAPEVDAREAPAAGSAPAIGAPQPQAAAPAQNTLDRGTRAAGSQPAIEWVNPSRATR